MMYVFVTYNKKVGYYQNPIYSEVEPNQFTTSTVRGINLNQEEALKHHMDECELYYLGTFDEERCVFDLKEKPVFLADYSVIFSNLPRKETHGN